MDSLVCLALAVTLFRSFEVEGYIISTGSMAPFLLGYHKRVACPVCGFSFAYGVVHGEETKSDEQGSVGGLTRVVCPNCGQRDIDVSHVPRNEGDQILVHKNAYMFQSPKRWDIVVFHNPNNPTQAYVKRMVGLSGERIQIVDGDVVINGEIQRKDLSRQREIRILVYDHDHRPRNDSAWKPRWVHEPGWTADGNGFQFDGLGKSTDVTLPPIAWVAYRHWIRFGGIHETSVPLDRWPKEVAMPASPFPRLRYDPSQKRLISTGVLPAELRDQLLAMTKETEFRLALTQLEEISHLAPITDDYGYNHSLESPDAVPVRDLMLAVRLSIQSGDGRFVMQMADGRHDYSCVFDIKADEVRLLIDGSVQPVRAARLPAAMLQGPVLIEMSTMDRQVLVAIEGKTVFAPWSIPPSADSISIPAPRRHIRFGARSLSLHVDSINLYRDVYYTGVNARNGVDQPYPLGNDEYFFLGDNSPVSLDSRSWANAVVKRGLLLGKPFLLHLPSRPGKIKIGNYECHIRIPDVARIRYIR